MIYFKYQPRGKSLETPYMAKQDLDSQVDETRILAKTHKRGKIHDKN